MNTKERLRNFVSNIRKDNKIQFAAEMIHLDFIYFVKQKMQKIGIYKTELAKRLGISKKHLLKLFSGDKLVNLIMIAHLQKILDIQFEISVKRNIF